MFGGTNTTSTWGNTNQNQQQQQQPTGAFGQPQTNAFGSGSAFGSGAFGNQQQQTTQPVNPMFGGAATTTTPASTGFGAFGNTGTSNSAFGAKPAGTAFGAFGGGNSTFGGGGSAFGNTNTGNTTTSAFGNASTSNAFGGNSLFGGAKPAAPTGTFGSVSNTATTNANGEAIVAPVTTGSANPPYSVVQEKDTTGTTPVTLHYQSISCIPAYRGTSFEEIRVQDYTQGRKAATTGGFGQTNSIFGANQPNQPTSAFGQTTQPTTFGAFSQANQPAQQQNTSGFGAFGQTTASQPSAFGAGGNSAFSAFGGQQNQSNQPAQGTGAFGAFGTSNQQQQQPAQGTSNIFGGFGANNNNNNNQTKPFGTFGSTGTNAFGSSNNAFGQANQQNTQQSASTGIFGQANNQPAQTTAFGGFGSNNNNQAKPSIFGGGNNTQPTGTGAFGGSLFGQNQNQNQTTQPSTGLFGNNNAGGGGIFGQNQNQQQAQPGQTTQPSGGLFGNTQQAQVPATGGLFGGSGGGSNNIFGNNNQQKPAFGTNLFGNNNATNNSNTQPQNNLFGQSSNQAAATPAGTSTFGSSFFGNKPTTSIFGQSSSQPAPNTGSSLFGSTLGGTGGGLFGATNSSQPSQPTLTASIAQPVSQNLPIFSLLQSGPQSAPVSSPPKKQSSYFVDVPTRSPLGLSMSRNLGASKLRGFGYSQSTNRKHISGFSNSLALSSNHSSPLHLSRGDGKSLLGPDSFLGTSTLGSDGRPSPKKLVLDKKMDPNEVFGKSISQMKSSPASASPKVAFNPAMSAALREKESLASSPVSTAIPGSPAAKKSTPLSATDAPGREKGPEDLQDGDYWVKPGLDVLRNTSNDELSQFKGLKVGRKGFGEVHFLEPVDLTALPRLSSLLGKIVQIDNKECCVYPDANDGANDDLKPPPGEGVNVKSRIVLFGCWPVDKATREPIKDESHPSFPKHLKRLKNMKHTQFESYSIEDGKWTFTVEHF